MLDARKFNQLSLDELYTILKLRQDVFICEQECIFEDIDLKDQSALHLLKKEGNSLQAYARLIFEEDNQITIGRIVIPLNARGSGAGKAFVKEILSYLKITYPHSKIRIDAQSRLQGFYEKLGFVMVGPEFFFEDDPIPHVPMDFNPSSFA